MMIFLPKNKNFFPGSIFPGLELFDRAIGDELKFSIISDEISTIPMHKWVSYPGYDEKMRIYPFFIFTKKIESSINRCPYIFQLINNIYGVKSAFIVRLKEKSKTLENNGWRQLTNKTLRCVIPLYSPMNDIDQCGVSCCDETKKISEETIVFDASKKHFFYNKRDKECMMLIIDINRPSDVSDGTSQRAIKKNNITKFMRNFV